MKLNKISKQGKKLNSIQMNALVIKLDKAIKRAGFISGVKIINSSAITISGHMRSFSIDVAKLGYNARVNQITATTTKAGFKRTDVPTWTQREQYNHIVNDVLDSLKLSANIKSGDYEVRSSVDGRVNSWELPEVHHNGFRLQVPGILEIVPIAKALEALEFLDVNAPFLAVVGE